MTWRALFPSQVLLVDTSTSRLVASFAGSVPSALLSQTRAALQARREESAARSSPPAPPVPTGPPAVPPDLPSVQSPIQRPEAGAATEAARLASKKLGEENAELRRSLARSQAAKAASEAAAQRARAEAELRVAEEERRVLRGQLAEAAKAAAAAAAEAAEAEAKAGEAEAAASAAVKAGEANAKAAVKVAASASPITTDATAAGAADTAPHRAASAIEPDAHLSCVAVGDTVSVVEKAAYGTDTRVKGIVQRVLMMGGRLDWRGSARSVPYGLGTRVRCSRAALTREASSASCRAASSAGPPRCTLGRSQVRPSDPTLHSKSSGRLWYEHSNGLRRNRAAR